MENRFVRLDVDTISDDARCAKCGYSLRGLVSSVCPECGADLAAADGVVLYGTARWGVMVSLFLLWTLVFAVACWGAVRAMLLMLPVKYQHVRQVHVNSSKSGALSEYFYIDFRQEATLPRILTHLERSWDRVDVVIRNQLNHAVPAAKLNLCVDDSADGLVRCTDRQPVDREVFLKWLADVGYVLGSDRSIVEGDAVWKCVESAAGDVRAQHLRLYFNIFDRGYPKQSRVPLMPNQDRVATGLMIAVFLYLWLRRSVRVVRHHRSQRTSLSLPVTDEG